eukprot:361546-Chlamydomonas_euryale.AAC.3
MPGHLCACGIPACFTSGGVQVAVRVANGGVHVADRFASGEVHVALCVTSGKGWFTCSRHIAEPSVSSASLRCGP